MVIKTYKYKRCIICYIREDNGLLTVCTGKPSDPFCISWKYKNIKDAELTANEYLKNYTRIEISRP